MIGASQAWKQTFNYDRYGNRNFDSANTTTISSCPVNQCNPTINTSNNRFNSGQGYSYDSSGNVISDAEGRTFIYDGENKQKEVKNSSNQVIGTYYYDGDGKRIKKVTASEQITFVFDAGGILVGEYSTVAPQVTEETRYLTNDHLGSPRIITDGSGSVISRRDFMPFGEEAFVGVGSRGTGHGYTNNGDSTRQKFTGYERDDETTLDFAKARMHNYNHGRFTSPDIPLFDQSTSNPQSWNLYIYVVNNPLLYKDPSGLWRWVDAGKNGERFLEWEEGDTWESLAEFLTTSGGWTYSVSGLALHYSNVVLGEGVILDTSTIPIGVKGEKGLIDTSEDLSGPGKGFALKKGTGVFKKFFGWLGKKFAKRQAKQLAKKGVKSFAELAASRLKGSSATEMLRDAVSTVKRFGGSASQKADLFEAFAKQISNRVPGWKATRNQGLDDSAIFVASKIGRVLVVSPKGNLYLGNITENINVLIYKGKNFIPNYKILKKIK